MSELSSLAGQFAGAIRRRLDHSLLLLRSEEYRGRNAGGCGLENLTPCLTNSSVSRLHKTKPTGWPNHHPPHPPPHPTTNHTTNYTTHHTTTHQEKLIVLTLLDTGLRVSELATLTKDNLDWQMHRLMIYGKGGPYGTKSKRRIIPLSPRVQPLLEGHLALNDKFGIGARTIQRLIKLVANKASISRPVSPHVLRHTFAVTAVQKGLSLPALQKLLGHDRLTTTEIYLNLSPEEAIREFQSKW